MQADLTLDVRFLEGEIGVYNVRRYRPALSYPGYQLAVPRVRFG